MRLYLSFACGKLPFAFLNLCCLLVDPPHFCAGLIEQFRCCCCLLIRGDTACCINS